MPLPVAHGFVGAAIVAAIHPKIDKIILVPLLLGGFIANAADLDFILSLSTGDKAWHRSFTHSLLFAAIVFVTFAVYFKKDRIRESIAYGLAYFSHLVLDYSTSDGGGPQLLWFFSSERFSVGIKSFSLAPSRLPASEIAIAVLWEILIFGFLFLAVYFFRWGFYSKD